MPPCQIECYLLMRMEIQELEEGNDDLEHHVRGAED